MNLPNPLQPRNPKAYTGLVRPMLDHERLHVYQLLLRFITWVTPLLEEAKTSAPGKTAEVRNQLDRASLSSLLNTAEGNGKRRGQVRARYFDDARGSATECAACLDALVAKSVLAPERILEGKAMLIEIVSMLCGLVDRFDETGCQCHEDSVKYRTFDAYAAQRKKRIRRPKK